MLLARVLTFALALPFPGAAQDLDHLGEEHRSWLERDVVYIITERERDLFLSLETVDERERFIEAFWRKRDPNRSTTANEFREEHYRRLAYADQYLGRESFLPGWRTDRGRYYIILGEPKQILRFYGQNELKESELWFYQGNARELPSFFYLLFYKREDVGDYRLYQPSIDGPVSLLRGPDVSAEMDPLVAVEKLEGYSPELAHASLSYDLSEPPDYMTGRPAMGVDAMIARVEESPKRAIRTDYIDGWEQYGRRVSSDYSFNFVPSRSAFSVLATEDGTPLVHFSVELDPESFGLQTDEEGKLYQTTLDVTVEATEEASGHAIFTSSRSTPVELTATEVERIQTDPVAYQDDFPLLPGSYTVSVILRNRARTNYTVAERRLAVPELSENRPEWTDVILAHEVETRTEDADLDPGEVRTFQLGSQRLSPATDRLFAIGDVIHVFAQAFAAPPGARARFALEDEEETFDEEAVTIGPEGGNGVLARLSTLGLAGGNYEVRAELLGPDGALLAERRAPVVLSPRTSVPRPGLVYRRGFNTKVPGLLPLTLGDQLWNLRRFEEAEAEYERAVAAGNDRLPHARWKLATAYLRRGEGPRAIELLAPLEQSHGGQYEVVAGLGLGFYLGQDFEKSVSYLERAASLRPPDTSLLNALGDAHQRLGDHASARRYFERSLSIDPDQEAVRSRLSKLPK